MGKWGVAFPLSFPSMIAKLIKMNAYGLNDKTFLCVKCKGQLSSHIKTFPQPQFEKYIPNQEREKSGNKQKEVVKRAANQLCIH